MPDTSDTGLQLVHLLIARLTIARLSRIAELRAINQSIERLEILRDQRVRHVRTRRYTRLSRNQVTADPNENIEHALYFSSQEHYPEDSESDTSLPALETLPTLDANELAAAERAFIEERGYLDTEAVDRSYLQRSITRRILNQGRQRPSHITNLSADSSLSELADAIVWDILSEIIHNLDREY